MSYDQIIQRTNVITQDSEHPNFPYAFIANVPFANFLSLATHTKVCATQLSNSSVDFARNKKFDVTSAQVNQRRQQLMSDGHTIFERKKSNKNNEKQIAKLEKAVDKIKAENAFLERVLKKSR